MEEQIPGLWNIENVEVFFDDEDTKAVVAVHALYSVRVSREKKGEDWEFFEEDTPEDLRGAVLAALRAADQKIEETEEFYKDKE